MMWWWLLRYLCFHVFTGRRDRVGLWAVPVCGNVCRWADKRIPSESPLLAPMVLTLTHHHSGLVSFSQTLTGRREFLCCNHVMKHATHRFRFLSFKMCFFTLIRFSCSTRVASINAILLASLLERLPAASYRSKVFLSRFPRSVRLQRWIATFANFMT